MFSALEAGERGDLCFINLHTSAAERVEMFPVASLVKSVSIIMSY